MTLQEAKDKVAEKYGYTTWKGFVSYEITKHATTQFWSFLDEAAELYARSKWDEACEAQKELIVARVTNCPSDKINAENTIKPPFNL